MTVAADDIRSESGLWVKSYSMNGVKYRTKSYSVWNNMKARCKVGGSVQHKQPTYVGCTMSENFKDYQFFAEWHTKQVGYSCRGYQLDKDLLVKGNKVYSEDTCVLVPRQLNTFFTDRAAQRGDCPLGFSHSKTYNKYIVHVSSEGRLKYLGWFETPEEAAAVYKQAKEAEALKWYEKLRSGEFIVDSRVLSMVQNWSVSS